MMCRFREPRRRSKMDNNSSSCKSSTHLMPALRDHCCLNMCRKTSDRYHDIVHLLYLRPCRYHEDLIEKYHRNPPIECMEFPAYALTIEFLRFVNIEQVRPDTTPLNPTPSPFLAAPNTKSHQSLHLALISLIARPGHTPVRSRNRGAKEVCS